LSFLSTELAKHTAAEPEPKKIVFDAGDGELRKAFTCVLYYF